VVGKGVGWADGVGNGVDDEGTPLALGAFENVGA